MVATLPLDSRRHARMSLMAQINAVSSSNFYTGWSENVSEGGVFVSMLHPPPVGEIVGLEIRLEDGAAFAVAGQVRWHRVGPDGLASGCGVQFIGMDEAACAALQAMLERSGQPPLLFE